MQARKKIAKRGVEIGVDLGKEVAALRDNHDWNSELSSSLDASVRYPDYYTRPFHAYDEGNLGWKPAFEVCPKQLPHRLDTCNLSSTCEAGSWKLEAGTEHALVGTCQGI